MSTKKANFFEFKIKANFFEFKINMKFKNPSRLIITNYFGGQRQDQFFANGALES